MPRNGSGTYTLPQSAFVAGTVISSAAVNSDFSDIATALTGSLPRDGQAGMLGQFKSVDGSSLAPGISFSNEPNTGFSRVSSGIIGINILGQQVGQITANGIAGSTPIGTVVNFAGTSIPSQWYLCYGQAVSRTTYAALFGAISTTFGSGDGATTFNLPDLRGRVIAGVDTMGGSGSGRIDTTVFNNVGLAGVGGAELITLSLAQLPVITSTGSTSGSLSVNANSTTGSFAFGSNISLNQPGTGSPTAYAVLSYGTVSSTGATSGALSVSAISNTSGGSHSNVQPSLLLNKIIYAGA